MIPWLELSLIGVLAALIWLWLDSLAARETAVRTARAACEAEGLLFLDDTVAIESRHGSIEGAALQRNGRARETQGNPGGDRSSAGGRRSVNFVARIAAARHKPSRDRVG